MDRTDFLLWLAIQEDLGHGDVTTEATVDQELDGEAVVIGREPFVLSGSYPFGRVFKLLDPGIVIEQYFSDGAKVSADTPVFRLRGKMRSLLTAERTALNLLQRFCGIATLTRQMVEALHGTECRLLDTRKTTPLWRSLEKQAVRDGGGNNHRFGLSDGILIKDNHIAAAGGVREAMRRARRQSSHMLKIEVEVENLDGLNEALDEGADIVLLDNFTPDLLRKAVATVRGRSLLEASGGVTLNNVRQIAETGVDFVSCGALTHSARAIDISLEIRSG